jgi:hypothetical protein
MDGPDIAEGHVTGKQTGNLIGFNVSSVSWILFIFSQTPYFIKGAWENKAAIFLGGLDLGILLFLLVLKKKGKIA